MAAEKKISKRKILIAEDEKSMQRALGMKFVIAGFDVATADDGKTALDLMAKTKFDVVLLDLMMPGVDGFMVLEELKKRNDHTPVIVSSNLSQENDIKRAKDLGVVDYFVKSDTTVSKVVEKVNKVIGV